MRDSRNSDRRRLGGCPLGASMVTEPACSAGGSTGWATPSELLVFF